MFVSSVVSCARVSFRVLVCESNQRAATALFPGNGSLCMGLPRASKTACDVKFSDGIKLIKCFCRLFSYEKLDIWYGAFWHVDAYLLDDVEDCGISLLEIGRQQLNSISIPWP